MEITPNPQSFEGSSSGTVVKIGPGDYTITEQLDPAKQNQLREDLSLPQGLVIFVVLRVDGDCTTLVTPIEANGNIQAGESQTCNIENVVNIRGGMVPQS